MLIHALLLPKLHHGHPSLISPLLPSHDLVPKPTTIITLFSKHSLMKLHCNFRLPNLGQCHAIRRRIRYDEEDDNGEEEYGHNSEIALMEAYSELARNEALLVTATVDGEESLVLVFKGFSSSLSSRTASDPSRSVLPARAVIQSIDVIKGPFDPSNIEYLEKNLSWDAFKARISP